MSETQAGPVRFRERLRQRTGEQDVLVVRIGAERFGIPLDAVGELVESPVLRKVPGAPDALLGIFTRGDAMLPLYSPSHLLGVASEREEIALVMRGGQRRIAIAVDDADDVVRVDLSAVREAPRADHADDLVLGVVWRDGNLVALVDARSLIATCHALFPEAA
jgi:chemotaxis signal transduction protein